MNCKTLHTKIIFYLEGSLPQVEMKEVQNHLDECPACVAFANKMEKTLAVLDNEKQQQVNPFFYTRLKTRLENQAFEKTRVKENPGLIRILQPAIFTFLLLGGIYAGIKIGEPAKFRSENLNKTENEMIPYLNEMETESIENFLME